MWNQIDLKYQNGAFGPIGEPETLLNYWTFMERNDYPHASEIRKMFAEKMQEQKELEAQQQQQNQVAQLMQMLGGGNGEPLS